MTCRSGAGAAKLFGAKSKAPGMRFPGLFAALAPLLQDGVIYQYSWTRASMIDGSSEMPRRSLDTST